ncbi:MAG: sialate O-acetylesterase, partial [Planctomycetota bacterium]
HLCGPKHDFEWSLRGDMRHFLGVGDLWVIAGQSNSAGYGKGPYCDPPELGVHLLDNALRWRLATQPLNESTDTAHVANTEAANPGHGPWLHFGRLLLQQTCVPVGLVQVSLGGSALSRWNPAEDGDSGLHELMVETVRYCGGRVRGILWYQGETDGNPEQGETYLERFEAAVAAWREALGDPALPVLTVQLNRSQGPSSAGSDRGWSLVREAQRQAARRDENIAVVPAIDCGMSDHVHNDPQGNMVLAQRTADAARAIAWGLDVDWKAPDVAGARRTKGDAVIELTFENVRYRLANNDNAAVAFRVEDEQGEVGVRKVQHTGDEHLRLHLDRPLEGSAVVHGAWGADPPRAPYDDVRHMPILGFADLPVE